jgi:hypothetical protein
MSAKAAELIPTHVTHYSARAISMRNNKYKKGHTIKEPRRENRPSANLVLDIRSQAKHSGRLYTRFCGEHWHTRVWTQVIDKGKQELTKS